MDRPTLPTMHPHGQSMIGDEFNPLYDKVRKGAKAPRRPRGISRSWWFRCDQTYRRQHLWCCVASAYYCPFCGKLDFDQNDGCRRLPRL